MTFNHLKIPAVLLVLLCLFISLYPVSHPVSAINEVRWVPVNIPTEGTVGEWVLASGSDIRYLTIASDGTLYCYANPPATPVTLFKSTDGGLGWVPLSQATEAITDIAVLSQDAASIYYATASCIFKSSDAGKTFTLLPSLPAGTGADNIRITSIDVIFKNTGNIIAVSTIDTDVAQYGGIYLLDENEGTWSDTDTGAYDVYCVAFSPDYNNDQQLIALMSDETDTCISSCTGNENWGESTGNASLPGIIPESGVIVFPDNYSGAIANATFFAGIDTGVNSGDVYKVTCAAVSTVVDLNIGASDGKDGIDITSLDINGSTILAGCGGDACTYLSSDGGISWTWCTKPPTGQSETSVTLSPCFTTEHKAYAVTCGIESAFSISNDGGVSWDQISLIDTKISSISDLAVSSSAVFMITHNAENLEHSFWRTSDGGNRWERIFCGIFKGINTLSSVKISRENNYFSPIILIAGQKDGNPTIWKSEDNGQTFFSLSAPCLVNAWGIADTSTWFIGGYNGTNAQIYRTTDGGYSYDIVAGAGNQPLNAVAVSPAYAVDKIVLAGNSTGQTYISDDNGVSYKLLGQQLPLFGGIGIVNIAFDNQFSTNRIIYAATDARVTSSSRERIFRFVLGQSNTWESICDSLPDNAVLKQVVVAADGTLYTANIQAVVSTENKGGILRSLDPNYLTPTFETALCGLEETVTLNKLVEYNNQLWTIDSKNTRLMTFIDSFTSQVSSYSPACFSQALEPSKIRLEWFMLPGATEYEWQLSKDLDFSSLPAGCSGTTSSNSARPDNLSPGTRYYWHVRAIKPFLSHWSDIWVFTTILAEAPELLLPQSGAETPLRPTFQWGTVTGASKYDLQVAKDSSFNDTVIDKTGDNAPTTNVWKSDIDLEHATTYYWRVMARSAESYSNWSAVSVFVTESMEVTEPDAGILTEPPVEEPPPPQPPITVTLFPRDTPTITVTEIITDNNMPAWAIYSGIGLSCIIIILAAMLIIIRQRRF